MSNFNTNILVFVVERAKRAKPLSTLEQITPIERYYNIDILGSKNEEKVTL